MGWGGGEDGREEHNFTADSGETSRTSLEIDNGGIDLHKILTAPAKARDARIAQRKGEVLGESFEGGRVLCDFNCADLQGEGSFGTKGEEGRTTWTRKGRKNTYVSDKYSPEVA